METMSDTSTEQENKWHASHGDQFKSLFDYLKHVSTLATGSILLLATFLEKLFAKPLHSWCVALSVGALLFSLIASSVAYTFLVLNYPRPDKREPPEWEWNVMAGSLLLTWLAFLIGIGAIAFFFLANWYGR